MFGSNPFGQSSSSNPFAPKPFGSSTSSFSSQTGSSLFGGMSTGVFGGQSSSPVGSTSVFGASSSPAFGSSTLTFGGSTGSAFGNTSSAFGGSSAFGATQPSFGGFGSNTTQASPFGSSFQQPQPAFGNTFSSSTPFGASSSPAFGATSSSAFGAPSTPAFGSTSTPAFGSTTSPTFGSTSGGFGASSSPFGSSTQVFGAPSASAFGASGTPAFGATATPAFGATTTPAFGASAAPAFGASSNPSFNLGSSPAFGQSTSAFGSSPFGATPSFGAPSTSFGTQTTAQTFGSLGLGQSAFGGQRGGTRVSPYSATLETDTGTQPAGKLQSISAMPVYKDKSHEELRWEDYQLQDKGGPAPAGQATAAGSFGSSGFGATQSATFSQAPANPFPSATSSNPFAPKQTAFNNSNFGSATGSAFGSSPFATSNTSNLFGSASSATASLFGSTAQPFGANPSSSVFNSSGSSAFGSPSIFGASSSQGTTSGLSSGLGGIGNTQSSPLFQSATPTLGQTSSPFGQTSSAFGQTTSAFGKTNLFNTPSTGFGGTSSLLSSTSTSTLGFGQTTPSLSTPFQSAQQAPGAINFSNFGQSQAAGTSGFGGTPSIFGNAAFGQAPVPQSSAAAQAPPIANPFGTLPMVPQVFGHAGTSPSMQYGISSLQVFEKPTTMRMSSPLTSRHLSQRRMQLTVRKYHPNTNSLKVAFFKDEEETESTPKADAQFVPRENPRALMIRPMEQWHSRSTAEKTKTTNTLLHENATPTKDPLENDLAKEELNPSKFNRKPNDIHDGLSTEKGDSYITRTGHRAGEAAIVYEHGAGIETLMPKLRHSDYYTEPRIQELAAKERAEPGYCRCVKNFVVGRNEYGSIKFSGETDVRRLDLESLIQFNNREVVVYMDESKKPPVGQGLNKAAEVTLLNIKCFDKKTGRQYTEGPRIEKYKEMLKRKAEDQGAEFVSYDAVKGEWKFRVSHFSTYKLGEEDDCSESVHV